MSDVAEQVVLDQSTRVIKNYTEIHHPFWQHGSILCSAQARVRWSPWGRGTSAKSADGPKYHFSIVGNQNALVSNKRDPNPPFTEISITTHFGLKVFRSTLHPFISVIPNDLASCMVRSTTFAGRMLPRHPAATAGQATGSGFRPFGKQRRLDDQAQEPSKAKSIRWLPISPSTPLPNSHRRFQFRFPPDQ